jgi:DNA ligase-1
MLAQKLTEKDLSNLQFPLAAQPKIDGIRGLIDGGKCLSRTFKPIPNKFIRSELERILPEGCDGEIISGSTFQQTSSSVMRFDGEPDFKFYLFDYVDPYVGPSEPYHKRYQAYKALDVGDSRVIKVKPEIVRSVEDLTVKEAEYLAQGFEGLILRGIHSPYKYGRSTLRESYLLKLKRWQDSEAEVVGLVEKLRNDNPAEEDAFGHMKRGHKAEFKVRSGTLGSLVVRDLYTKVEFEIGSGFTDAMRDWCWTHPVLGLIASYKFFPVGVKDKPRHPIFKGFRDQIDL